MNNTIIAETSLLVSEYEDTQKEIEESFRQVVALIKEIETKASGQKQRFNQALKIIEDNERFYRDSLHLVELSEDLSVADELLIYRQLKEATKVRRIGKDMLQHTGLTTLEITRMFSGQSNHIGHLKRTDVPVIRSTEKLASALSHIQTTISQVTDKKDFQLSLCEYSGERYYRVRSRKGGIRIKAINRTIENIRFHSKKLNKYVIQPDAVIEEE